MEKEFLPIINLEKCTRCGICIDSCPFQALKMTKQGPQFIHPSTCTYCTECEEVCPVNAIRAPLMVTWAT